MTVALDLKITVLSDEEAGKIWKTQSRRAPNYASYASFMNAQDLGASFDVEVPGGDPDNARIIKYNFAEAAKERTTTRPLDMGKLTPEQTAALQQAGTGPFTVGDVEYHQQDGKWAAAVPAPVIVRWKHDERTVKVKKDGKDVEQKQIVALHGHIIATEAVVKRGPRAKAADAPADSTADQTSANGTADTTAAGAGTVDGADVPPAPFDAPLSDSANGTPADSKTDSEPAKQPAGKK